MYYKKDFILGMVISLKKKRIFGQKSDRLAQCASVKSMFDHKVRICIETPFALPEPLPNLY